MKTRAVRLHGANDLRMDEFELPEIKDDEILVKVVSDSICMSTYKCAILGTEHKRVHDDVAEHPAIMGHEFAGVVEDVGPGVDKNLFRKRMGVFPLIPCGKCMPCRQGHYEMCRSYGYLGSRCDGGFGEYVCVPAKNLIEIPEDVSFEEAAMLEPMAVAAHAMRRGITGRKKESLIALCGFGTIGMLIASLLLEAGYANIYVIGNKEFQRKQAIAIGISKERYFDSRKEDGAEWLQKERGGRSGCLF